MNAAAALCAATVGTFALRQLSVRALANRELPPVVGHALRHAALAVMAALVMSSLPTTERLDLPTAAAIAGTGAACVIARRTRNLAAAIAIGLVVYAALR
jgi:branched-subunit amino acid transport protein